MTITQRLFLTFSLLSASLITLVFVSVMIVTGFQSRFQYVQSNTVPSIIDIGKMVDGSNQLLIWMYRHQSATDPGRQAEVEKQLGEQLNNLKSLNQFYLDNDVSSEEDRRMTEAGFATIQVIQNKLPTFLKASQQQNDAISLSEIQGSNGAGAAARSLIAGYKKQLQLNVDIGEGLKNQNTRVYQATFWGMISGASILILILGFFAIKTIAGIRRSLNAMRSTMEQASSRLDLTLRADDSRKDEIGLTAQAFNNLVANVASSLLSVSSSSQSVSTASSQISAGNEDLSARTEEQAASLEQTAASMSELSETVRQTAENTGMASQLSQNARKLSEDSSVKVGAMMGTMSDIRNSSAKITDIISLIEGIAFQTNILALNAAVEAARAGEQGRGFAVVAGEVRNLAQRSSASAREIKELIESSIKFVEKGAGQADEVGQNMGDMNEAISQVADLVNEIAAAAHEQMQGIGQVHQAVNQMDDVTQQNATLVQEASAASHSLMEQATVLNELVATFVIKVPSELKSKDAISASGVKLSPSHGTTVKKKTAGLEENWKSF
ncbi:Methyl-accepting chemotaxis protein (plasmid) [Erwinia billingiae Eb661]|uniref:Methyl-accepting chemotaxis protein n=1 Tax=Erwinia billingiae (strain Eb661) TaxID=634500 RepID=D8MJQ5_ERWBE|nr:methyl-accepting chemotaxis protein [Erwinia billingiae]CAX53503.1 Methyl-accepting chemotaxis protein [Erwinia billingiae Eb661]